jgi:hypothetical protein
MPVIDVGGGNAEVPSLVYPKLYGGGDVVPPASVQQMKTTITTSVAAQTSMTILVDSAGTAYIKGTDNSIYTYKADGTAGYMISGLTLTYWDFASDGNIYGVAGTTTSIYRIKTSDGTSYSPLSITGNCKSICGAYPGYLFVGTTTGLYRINLTTMTVDKSFTGFSLGANGVCGLTYDPVNNLVYALVYWSSSPNYQLWKFSVDLSSGLYIYSMSATPSSTWAQGAIAVDSLGYVNYALSTTNSVIYKINSAGSVVASKTLTGIAAAHVYADGQGVIYAYYNNTVCRLDSNLNTTWEFRGLLAAGAYCGVGSTGYCMVPDAASTWNIMYSGVLVTS